MSGGAQGAGDFDEYQVHIPDSFLAHYRDARNRLTATRETIAARYELCEDLANALVEPCRTVHFRDGVDEATVLQRCHLALMASHASIASTESAWVLRRAAELLGWNKD